MSGLTYNITSNPTSELIFHHSMRGLSKDILLVALLENFCRENGDKKLNAYKKITSSLHNNNVITNAVLKKSTSVLKSRCISHILNVINNEISNDDEVLCPVEGYIHNMLTKKTVSTYHSFECIDEIGYGGSSSVYKVKSIIDHKNYALKQVPLSDDNIKYIRESIILSNMEHKNIIRYSTSWIDRDYFDKYKNDKKWLTKTVGEKIYLYIQMELCDLTLTDINTMKLHINEKNNIYLQLLQGIEYIHSIDYVHRDIKPKNIMLRINNGKYVVKICDFGVATYVGGIKHDTEHKNYNMNINGQTTIGTELYIDDELKNTNIYNMDKRIDIYPLGIIYFEMLIDYNTEMERICSIEALKRGNYERIMDCEKSKFIERLVSPILDRPYIEEVIDKFNKL